MSLFDMITGKAEELAGKVGIPSETVLSVASMIEAKTGDGSSHLEAIQAAAAEHGLSVEKVQELMGHAGISSDGVMGKISGIAGGLFKS